MTMAGEHQVEPRGILAVGDQHAQAAMRAHQFCGEQDDEGVREADPRAGNNCGAAAGIRRERTSLSAARPCSAPPTPHACSTDRTAWRDAMNTGKKQENATMAIFEFVAETEQQQKYRQERDFRDCKQERYQRIEEIPHAGRRPAARPTTCRRRCRDKSDDDAKQADCNRARQFAIARGFKERGRDKGRRRQIVRQQSGAAEGLPGGEEGDRDDPMLDGDRDSSRFLQRARLEHLVAQQIPDFSAHTADIQPTCGSRRCASTSGMSMSALIRPGAP